MEANEKIEHDRLMKSPLYIQGKKDGKRGVPSRSDYWDDYSKGYYEGTIERENLFNDRSEK